MDQSEDVGVPTGEPTPGEKIPQRPSKKEQAKEAMHDAAKDQVKQGARKVIAQAAKAAARAVAQAAVSAATAVAGAIGWPFAIGCIIIFLIILLVAGGIASNALRGGYGKTIPNPAGTNDANLKQLLSYNQQISRGTYKKIDFLKNRDLEYVKSGMPDSRLMAALKYLADKHERLQIDHIISDYENMQTDPESSGSNTQIITNISAHKDGLAADLGEIDFVFRVFEENTECSSGTGGTTGDIVYYNDLNQELLRLKCQGDLTEISKANTTWQGKPATAIPISVRWQDDKPEDIAWLKNISDPADVTDPIEKQVYDQVYRPEARRKIHLVVGQLLQFPYDLNDTDKYRVTQLITFSKARDVTPFEDKLDKLYGANRPWNFGLFSMRESWAGIHIAY